MITHKTIALVIISYTALSSPSSAEGSCNINISPPQNISADPFYIDSKGSIPDRSIVDRNDTRLKPLDASIHQVVISSDEYMTTGKIEFADCANRQLVAFSRARAMLGTMSSNQARVERLWRSTGLSVIYFNTRRYASPEDRRSIDSWISELSKLVDNDFNGYTNNIRAWVSLLLFSSGISTDNKLQVNTAIGYYKGVISEIDSGGLLPKELARGERALHYHNFALGPLLETAAMAKTQGINIETYKNGSLFRLANAVCDAISGRAKTSPLATRQLKPQPQDLGWLEFYRALSDRRLSCAETNTTYRNAALGGNLRAMAYKWKSKQQISAAPRLETTHRRRQK